MSERATVRRWKESDLGKVPEDWNVDTVLNLGGQITSGSRGWAQFYSEYGDLFVRITNLRRSSIEPDLSSPRFVNLEGNNTEANRTRLRVGDVLVSITADIGIIGFVDENFPIPSYINQHIARVRFTDSGVSSKFIAYYLASWVPQRRFVGSTDTGAKAGLNLATVGNLMTVVPPLAEQLQIAEALGDIDDQIATFERLLLKKQAIKQGMMQQLLTGKTRLPGFTDRWLATRFEELAAPALQRVDPRGVPAGTRLVDLEHIDSGGGRLLASATASGAVSLKTVFQPGDVLFGKLRAYLRKYWLADVPGICSTEIWVLRSKPLAENGYVRYLVETDRFIEVASGGYGTHMPRSDWGTLRGLEFEVPPVDEQKAIAAALTEVDDEINGLSFRLAKTKAIKQGMMQELLTGQTRLLVEKGAA